MNKRRIVFSGIVTSVVGLGLGLVLFRLAPTPYSSALYRNLDSKYAAIGGVAGLLFGASQEAIRQLKRQCDAEEAEAEQCRLSKQMLLSFHPDEAKVLNKHIAGQRDQI